jgi:hypothetical protein
MNGYIYDSSNYKPASEQKNYVALVTGRHPQYLLERKFLRNPDPEHPALWQLPEYPHNGLVLDVFGNYSQYDRGHWRPVTLGKVLAYFSRVDN